MKWMKRLLALSLILTPVIGVYCYYTKFGDLPQSQLTSENLSEDMRSAIVLPAPPPVIAEVNERNSKIKTFNCEDVNIRFLQKGIKLRLNGRMYYEKEKKFRFTVSSIVGQEVDVGSNATEFWFWSKRMNPASLHYAKHEDFQKTRMKTPFSPFLLMDSLGIGQLNVDVGKIVETNKSYIWVEPGVNSIGQPISRMTFINKNSKLIDGFTICNEAGNVLASGEVLEYKDGLPKQILYVWSEENLSMLMDFKNPRTNAPIDPSLFNRPDIRPQVDMGKD
jgi:outer membrane lipoprotein-sorting protein